MFLKMNNDNNLTQKKIKELLNINDLNELKLSNFIYLKNDINTVDIINNVLNFYKVLIE